MWCISINVHQHNRNQGEEKSTAKGNKTITNEYNYVLNDTFQGKQMQFVII